LKNIGILAVALVAALVLGFGARLSTQTAHAQVTGSVVIGCEFLVGAIDGDTEDAVVAGDITAACNGLTAADIDALAGGTLAGQNGLGDDDGVLEASDFAAIDLDGNQITDTGTQVTYAIAFVDNDGAVLFDAQVGLNVAVNDDGCVGTPTTTVSTILRNTTATVSTIASVGTVAPYTITTAAVHNLTAGDTVTITGSTTTPSINGTFTVAAVTPTTLDITGSPVVTATGVGTITPAVITTTAAHNLAVGDTVTITASNSTLPINGTTTVASVPSVTTLTLTVYPAVTVAGTTGTITPSTTPSTSCLTFAVAAPVSDLNPETCGAAEGLDLDCDAVLNNGDGVVVATLTDGTAAAGASINVDISQGSDISTETIFIMGVPDSVTLAAIETVIQTNGTNALANTCVNESDVTDSGQLSDLNKTFVKATVTDSAGRELTRADVDFTTDDAAISRIDDDAGETGADPKGQTVISVDAGDAGIGAFAVVCGGPDTGTATISAEINNDTVTLLDDETATVEIEVVGVAAVVALTVSPAAIDCDGTQTATVTATVTDADGNNVADGTNVNFSVVALGTANPINVDTVDGAASSTITPLSTSTAGVTVIVTSGAAQASVRVDCNIAAAGTPVGGAPTATPRTGIGVSDTGTGGYLGQDNSAGFPLWTLVALALGSMALVAGGMVTRRAGK